MARDTGGPAFPAKLDAPPLGEGLQARAFNHTSGMSLRDWFAGQALVGMGTWMPNVGTGLLQHPDTLRTRAEWAYAQADAMLTAREAT